MPLVKTPTGLEFVDEPHPLLVVSPSWYTSFAAVLRTTGEHFGDMPTDHPHLVTLRHALTATYHQETKKRKDKAPALHCYALAAWFAFQSGDAAFSSHATITRKSWVQRAHTIARRL